MPRMALDWQEGGPNPSASPTASLAAILGQIPTGLTQPWPPPVLLCALAVLLPSPLCSLLQILAGSGPQNTLEFTLILLDGTQHWHCGCKRLLELGGLTAAAPLMPQSGVLLFALAICCAVPCALAFTLAPLAPLTMRTW